MASTLARNILSRRSYSHRLNSPEAQLFVQEVLLPNNPDSKVHGSDMGSTWVLSAPDGPHVGPMNLAMRESIKAQCCNLFEGINGVTGGCLSQRVSDAENTPLSCRQHVFAIFPDDGLLNHVIPASPLNNWHPFTRSSRRGIQPCIKPYGGDIGKLWNTTVRSFWYNNSFLRGNVIGKIIYQTWITARTQSKINQQNNKLTRQLLS